MTDDSVHSYMRDLGRRKPLTPQEEHDLAVEIRDLERAFWAGLLRHAEPAVREVWSQRVTGYTRSCAVILAWLGGAAEPVGLVDQFRLHDGMRRLPPLVLSAARGVCEPEPLRVAEGQHRRIMRLRTRFIEGNLRLAVKFAQFWKGAAPFLDLIQEANLGICRAVSTFNPDKGTKFSTYAGWWIKNTVVRYLETSERVIRLPAWLTEAQVKYRQTAQQVRAKHDREATPQEIAQVLRWSADRLQTVLDSLTIPHEVASLDAKDDPEDRDLHERLSQQQSGEQAAPEDVIDERRRAADLAALVEQIPRPMTRDVLRRRYGLDGYTPEILDTIAKRYKVTRQWVQWLEREGVLYLQKHGQQLAQSEEAGA